MLYHFETAELKDLKPDFVRKDLDAALTFAEIARQTGDRAKAMRNQRNARSGYDAIIRYIGTVNLNRVESENITRKLALLKSALLSLGESFSDF